MHDKADRKKLDHSNYTHDTNSDDYIFNKGYAIIMRIDWCYVNTNKTEVGMKIVSDWLVFRRNKAYICEFKI